MDTVIAWLGALGAWLLVAGPLNQAALELAEQETVPREEFERLNHTVEPEPGFSAWWWLLPPIAYAKAARRGARQRERVMALLTAEQTRNVLSFLNKGTGWFLVASGAALIAAKETWDIVVHMDWPLGSFFALYAAAAFLATVYTVSRQRRSHEQVAKAEQREGVGRVAP